MRWKCSLWAVSIISGLLFFMLSEDAQALTGFARKYQTSCVTCHESPPRLNKDGESFRLNGYKFQDDETKRKVEPLELGDEAYERLWPEAIWPGTAPRYTPLSIITTWIAEYHTDAGVDPLTGEDRPTVSLLMPHEIEMAWADNFGEHISLYGDARFIQEDYGGNDITSWLMLKGWIQFEDLFGWENKLNLQVGSVGMHTIGLLNARNEQGLPFQNYLMNGVSMPDLLLDIVGNYGQDDTIRSFTGNTFVIQSQTGIEFNGFTKHLLYYAGVVNGKIKNPFGSEPEDSVFFMGAGYNTSVKDYYGGFAIKIGGTGFEASSAKEDMPPTEAVSEPTPASGESKFWRDDSLIISFFGYTGEGQVVIERWNDPTDKTRVTGYTVEYHDDDFWRAGVGLQQKYQDFLISGGYMWGKNDNPYGSVYSGEVKTGAWFVESYYFAYPWLVPFVRYEGVDFEGLPTLADDGVQLSGEEDRTILTAGCRFQIRPNIQLNFEGYYYTDDAGFDYALDKSLFLVLMAGF